jgi:hypothetical protein
MLPSPQGHKLVENAIAVALPDALQLFAKAPAVHSENQKKKNLNDRVAFAVP